MEAEGQIAGASPRESSQGKEPVPTLSALRRFAGARSKTDAERCELCATALNDNHPHLLNRASRQIACACDACAILFCGQEGANFLRVPRRILKPMSFRFTDAEWDSMTLPINLAFFLRQPNGETAALYPSPAGVMESMIELPPWDELFAGQPTLLGIEPEVEALLVNRIGVASGRESPSDTHAAFIVPIDAAYRLVGLIRTKWRGLSGGHEVWQAIADFFAALERQAVPVGEAAHA
ncbi:MAG TPA: DUF5947 family protein [Acidobacteriaceae bacterium]|jgi:hypothetical protein